MNRFIAAVSILALLASPALAQSDAHDHHPVSPADQAAPAPAPTNSQGMMGQGRGMGIGMMGPDMMNCPMMGQGMMGSGGPHTEGRLAYLKTELKITDAQEKAWKAYGDAVRSIDQKRSAQMSMMGQGRGMGTGMMGPGMTSGGGMMQQGPALPAPDALEKRVQLMKEHVENLKDLQSATKKLYRDLDEAQKKTADELLAMPCCMGAM